MIKYFLHQPMSLKVTMTSEVMEKFDNQLMINFNVLLMNRKVERAEIEFFITASDMFDFIISNFTSNKDKLTNPGDIKRSNQIAKCQECN